MGTDSLQKEYDEFKIRLEFGKLFCDIEMELDNVFLGHAITNNSEKHSHYSYEFHMITKSEGILYIGQTELPLRDSDCVLIGKDVYHSIFSLTPDFHKYDFRFHFSKRKGKYESVQIDEANNIQLIFEQGFFCRVLSNTRELFTLMNAIIQEIKEKNIFYYSRIKSLFTSLIIAIARDIAPKVLTEHDIPKKVKDDNRTWIIEKFFDHYNHNLKASDLSKLLSVSDRQLNRIMQKTHHTSFKQKLIDIRIEVAKDLLRDKNVSIEKVAEDVGYPSVKTFYALFKKKTGVRPNQYRNSLTKS